MLLLGVLQAQAAGGVVGVDAFDLLETQTLGTAAASVTFSSLSTYAADYQHLQIRMVAKSADGVSSNLRDLRIQVNADTAANYAAHVLRETGQVFIQTAPPIKLPLLLLPQCCLDRVTQQPTSGQQL